MTTTFPRIRRRVKGIGLVQLTTDARTKREHERRAAVFGELVEAGQLSVIREPVAGHVTWNEVIDHRREHGAFGSGVLQDIAARRSLHQAIEATLPRMGRGENGRKRYRVTWRRLQKLRPNLLVADLLTIDWNALMSEWSNSPSDWNHLGRFLSAFLSRYLSKRHELRGKVLEAFPRRREASRVPDLTPAVFWSIVDAAPAHARASYVTLLLTGLRVQTEYLACTRSHLRPATYQIMVPTEVKTDGSVGVVSVDPVDWPWIDAAVPARLHYKWLRLHWCRACVAVGAATFDEPEAERGYHGPTLHSLRHALAQWSTDAGVSLGDVKAQLRHTNLSTTEAYARRSASRKVSAAMSLLIRRENTGT